MREANYTARLRKDLRQYVYCLKNANAYTSGVPDCYYSGARADLWTEHKKFDTLPPVIDLTKLTVTSALQQDWLVQRHREGRNVGMVVFSPKAHLFLPGLTWQDPIERDEYRARAHKNYKNLAKELIEFLGALKEPPRP